MENLATLTTNERGLSERPRLGGAFASYVKYRGEPDGKTMETLSMSTQRLNCQADDGPFKFNILRILSSYILVYSFYFIQLLQTNQAKVLLLVLLRV